MKYLKIWILLNVLAITLSSAQDHELIYSYYPIPVEKNGKWAYKNVNGKRITKFKYDDAKRFSAEVAAFLIDEKWGLIDVDGNEVTPPKYDFEPRFSEGRALVSYNYKTGFIDIMGNEIVELKYDWAFPFKEDRSMIRLDEKWGYIDKNGIEVIPISYDVAYPFSKGYAIVGRNEISSEDRTEKLPGVIRKERVNEQVTETLFGVIDLDGNIVIDLKYQFDPYYSSNYVNYGFYDGLLPFGKDGKYGFINIIEDTLVEFKYDQVKGFSKGLASLAAVRLGDKWGYIDRRGKVIISIAYDDAKTFVEGLAAVERNEKWSFVDKLGVEIAEFKYDNVMDFSEGLAVVYRDEKYGYINSEGKEVIPVKFSNAKSFEDGKAMIFIDGKVGIIGKDGQLKRGRFDIRRFGTPIDAEEYIDPSQKY